MLSLGRHIGEEVVIEAPDGTRITVTVTRIMTRSQIKLGFRAPSQYRILRGEVVDKAPDDDQD